MSVFDMFLWRPRSFTVMLFWNWNVQSSFWYYYAYTCGFLRCTCKETRTNLLAFFNVSFLWGQASVMSSFTKNDPHFVCMCMYGITLVTLILKDFSKLRLKLCYFDLSGYKNRTRKQRRGMVKNSQYTLHFSFYEAQILLKHLRVYKIIELF